MTRSFGAQLHFWRWLAFSLFFSAWPALVSGAAEGSRTRTSVYSLSTIVVYNTAVPESGELASFYAEARGIPASNIVALTCPDREQISRKEYEETIVKPLRDAFSGNQWWKVSLDPDRGIEVLANRIHVIALIYGIPLKMPNDVPLPEPKIDPQTGKPIPVPSGPFATSACSVDAELCLLAGYNLDLNGPLKNPYYKEFGNFYQARIPGMMLVGRIDGPNPGVVKRMISDAIAAEETGLWGMAYVDQAQKTGAGLKEGDDWLKRSAEAYEKEGIPVVLDIHAARFATNYPMRDASLYFGWYTADADGPFVNPRFRFTPGAVACHLHSFSADTVRSTTAKWAGPLLDRGAAAVLGNVHEPYLNLTHNFDIFNSRLLGGFTFIESAYMALPALSWMNVAIGDPLYRPFEAFNRLDPETYSKDENAAFKALHLAAKRWGDDPLTLRGKLEDAAVKLKSGVIYESIALQAMREEKFLKAKGFLESALAAYGDDADKLRIRLHEVDVARLQGKKDEAVALLEALPRQFSNLPEAMAAVALYEELRPPLPPLPPPPGANP